MNAMANTNFMSGIRGNVLGLYGKLEIPPMISEEPRANRYPLADRLVSADVKK